MNRLFPGWGKLVPTLSSVLPAGPGGRGDPGCPSRAGNVGKTAVLCLAPDEGLGVEDPGRGASAPAASPASASSATPDAPFRGSRGHKTAAPHSGLCPR